MSATASRALTTSPDRSVPWRNMAWVTWRRHRTTAMAILGVLGLTAIYLVVTGVEMRSAWHTVQACTPQQSSACNFEWTNFQDTHSNPGLVSALFLFAPLLIGVFVGAPLIGRELEAGTFRYAWTQGVDRVRWAVAMIVTGATVVAVLTGALGVLISWHDHPLWQAQITPRLQASEFPATGLAIVGWAVAAYAAGVLAGLLWRRVLPAFATAMVTTFGLAFVVSKLRMHYLAPLKTSSLAYVPGSQPISQWWEKDGTRVSIAELNRVLRAGGVQQVQSGGGGKLTVTARPNQGTDPMTYLLHHGYVQWTGYQPGSRYWTFQWIEFGWLAALAAALLVVTLLLLRHRDA
jgi:hypothetical protein